MSDAARIYSLMCLSLNLHCSCVFAVSFVVRVCELLCINSIICDRGNKAGAQIVLGEFIHAVVFSM